MKIKILHVTYDMAIGGTEQVIRQLVENTDPEKFEVAILCLENNIGDIGQELIKQGIKVSKLNRQEGFDFSLLRAIRQFIRANQIDILHCHQYTPYSYGILASFFTAVKVIFTEHGRFYPDSSSWKRRIINPVLAMVTDRITSISEATREALIRYEFLPGKQIQVIYNGIADLSKNTYDVLTLRNELGLDENNIVLGTISRLDPIKNHQMMLSAFKSVEVQYSEARLLIVGDGPLMQELKQQCEQLDIVNKVIFTGFIIEPQKLLKIMDIFLLPSLSEGTSMTLLEAMSFSKPCIVTDVGGNPEIVKNEETGLIIPSGDVNALTKSCLDLINNKQKQITLGQNGRERYKKSFTVTNMIAEFEALYGSVLKE